MLQAVPPPSPPTPSSSRPPVSGPSVGGKRQRSDPHSRRPAENSAAIAQPGPGGGELFEAEAQGVLSRLCAAAKRLVKSSPTEIGKAADLHRALGVRPSLGWEVYKLAHAESPLGGIAYVPKPDPMASVLKAAGENGFKAEAIAVVERAYAEFESLVARHAPNRTTFDTMVAALAAHEAPEQIGLKQRKAAYQANAQVWGFHAQAVYACSIWHAGATAGTEDIVSVAGIVGLRQLRQLAAIPLSGRSIVVERGEPSTDYLPRSSQEILEEFTSKPMPVFEVEREAGNWREVLRLNGVGKGHDSTCFLVQATGQGTPTPAAPEWGIGRLLTIPSEWHILDLLVPRGWADVGSVAVSTYGHPADMMAVQHLPETYRMPSLERGEHLGIFVDKLVDPEIPNCPEVVRSVLLRQGWQNTVFDIFRCRIRYPVFHAMNIMEVKAARHKDA